MIILPKTEDSGVISLAHPWFMISRSAREVCHNFPIISPLYPHSILVGGFNHLDKYESQWEGLSHILWTIKFMFETTIQLLPSATSLPSAPARNGYSPWLAERRRTTPRVAATAARALRSLPKIDLGGFAHQNPWIVFWNLSISNTRLWKN